MKILIPGGDGMIGYQFFQALSQNHEVKVTLRRDASYYEKFRVFNGNNSYFGIDLFSTEKLMDIIGDYQPDVLINAAGLIKHRENRNEVITNLEINALLPHRLSRLCKLSGTRLVQLSSDCVFKGDRGNYQESDVPDATDIYGKTKFLGELHDDHAITIRTSTIGLELHRNTGLIEWFLAQKGRIKGFSKAIYTGVTTLELVRVVELVLMKYPDLSGVWQVAADKINKYELLCRLKEKLDKKRYFY